MSLTETCFYSRLYGMYAFWCGNVTKFDTHLQKYIFSLVFRICWFELRTFSKIVIVISLILWLFSLKCFPVALLIILFATYPLCSENLSFKDLSVSPICCLGHLLHPSKYIILLLAQVTLLLISTLQLFDVEATVFPSLTNGFFHS